MRDEIRAVRPATSLSPACYSVAYFNRPWRGGDEPDSGYMQCRCPQYHPMAW